MKLPPDEGPGQINHRGQGHYQAEILDYLGKGGQREEHPAEEEHRRDKQSEIVVKAVE